MVAPCRHANKAIMVIAPEETIQQTNNAFSSEHSAPGLTMWAALASDDVLEVGQGIIGEEMCLFLSFTIKTWYLRADTLLAVKSNSIR